MLYYLQKYSVSSILSCLTFGQPHINKKWTQLRRLLKWKSICQVTYTFVANCFVFRCPLKNLKAYIQLVVPRDHQMSQLSCKQLISRLRNVFDILYTALRIKTDVLYDQYSPYDSSLGLWWNIIPWPFRQSHIAFIIRQASHLAW